MAGRLTRRSLLALGGAGLVGLLAACKPGQIPLTAPPAATRAPDRARKAVDLWNGPGVDARVLFQREVDPLPEGPFMLRVTELEMAPGAVIDPHSHIGPGAQVLLAGAFTVIDGASGAVTVYQSTPVDPFPVFYTGPTTRYSTENRSQAPNRLFMTELLPRSREFLGNQRFDTEGEVHNRGGVRSGPYLQTKLEHLPEPPLMVRVTQINMGPKGKSPEYTRPGPGLFFVVSGQGTFRRQADLWITTQGAGGYFLDEGVEPIILENKPITPNQIIAVEFLPASLGKQPSTVPTGREL